MTTANRLMSVWVSKHGFKGKNLNNLRVIVEFIVSVYYPVWFDVKVRNSFVNGPRHLLKQLELKKV